MSEQRWPNRLVVWAERTLDRSTFDRVIVPALADLEHECAAADGSMDEASRVLAGALGTAQGRRAVLAPWWIEGRPQNRSCRGCADVLHHAAGDCHLVGTDCFVDIWLWPDVRIYERYYGTDVSTASERSAGDSRELLLVARVSS